MAPKSAMNKRPTRGQARPQPSQAPQRPLERLSPGVYRGAGGQLTNQAGRPLPGSRPPTGGPAFAGGMGQGVGAALQGGMRQSPRGLEDVARQRADAINRGGMVTMDYNPEREALTNQYLEELRRGQRQPGMTPEALPGAVAGMTPGFTQGFGQGVGSMMGETMQAGPFPLGYGQGVAAGFPLAQGYGKGLGQEINNPNLPRSPQALQQQYAAARLRRGM